MSQNALCGILLLLQPHLDPRLIIQLFSLLWRSKDASCFLLLPPPYPLVGSACRSSHRETPSHSIATGIPCLIFPFMPVRRASLRRAPIDARAPLAIRTTNIFPLFTLHSIFPFVALLPIFPLFPLPLIPLFIPIPIPQISLRQSPRRPIWPSYQLRIIHVVGLVQLCIRQITLSVRLCAFPDLALAIGPGWSSSLKGCGAVSAGWAGACAGACTGAGRCSRGTGGGWDGGGGGQSEAEWQCEMGG